MAILYFKKDLHAQGSGVFVHVAGSIVVTFFVLRMFAVTLRHTRNHSGGVLRFVERDQVWIFDEFFTHACFVKEGNGRRGVN